MHEASIQRATQPARSALIDVAKGLAIILVVYGHCLRGLTGADLVDNQSWLQVTDYLIYTFHMPLFFFVSGIFVHASIAKGTARFWRSKALRIVYPYLLWSLLQGTIQVALASTSVTNGALMPSALLAILWEPISPFWFLYAMFFAMVAAFVLRRRRPELLAALALGALLATTLSLPQVLNDIAYGTFYLALGMVAKERCWLPSLVEGGTRAVITLAVLFALTAAICFMIRTPERLALPTAFFGIAATLSLCAVMCQNWPGGAVVLATIGRASMAIYVMHVLVLGLSRLMMVLAGVTDVALLLVMCTTAGVVVPFVAQAALSRLQLSGMFGLPQIPREFPARA